VHKTSLVLGAVFSMLSVVLGAFGAHALKQVLSPELLQTFETGVRYQFYHSFALLICGIVYAYYPVKAMRIASNLFTVGIVLFSGSIYALVTLKSQGQVGLAGIGILTPTGGLMFILAWIFFILGVVKKN
jgi:uncharacterized membrane protein YgdD (TMEM256/DUF423 family)